MELEKLSAETEASVIKAKTQAMYPHPNVNNQSQQ
jgi:hypothetical protein